MPQLRSGVRRGRRTAVQPGPDKGKTPSKKATGRAAGERTVGKINNNVDSGNKDKEVLVVGDGDSGERNDDAALRKTASFKIEDNNNRVKEVKEEVAEKKMDECDSGGRGSDKGLGAEDEAAPLPERVRYIILFRMFLYFIYADRVRKLLVIV